jgi:hypothetical protein
MCGDLFNVLQWRASDLLVWNSVDTTSKTKIKVFDLVDLVKKKEYFVDEPNNKLSNYTTLRVVIIFLQLVLFEKKPK